MTLRFARFSDNLGRPGVVLRAQNGDDVIRFGVVKTRGEFELSTREARQMRRTLVSRLKHELRISQ